MERKRKKKASAKREPEKKNTRKLGRERDGVLHFVLHRSLDRGQTREIFEKQEKYSTGKFVTCPVQSLIRYQYPVDLLTLLELC